MLHARIWATTAAPNSKISWSLAKTAQQVSTTRANPALLIIWIVLARHFKKEVMQAHNSSWNRLPLGLTAPSRACNKGLLRAGSTAIIFLLSTTKARFRPLVSTSPNKSNLLKTYNRQTYCLIHRARPHSNYKRALRNCEQTPCNCIRRCQISSFKIIRIPLTPGYR